MRPRVPRCPDVELLRLLLTIALGLGVLVLLHWLAGPPALSGGAAAILGALGREIIAYARAQR